MTLYCIIETESGWTITEHDDSATAEETARRRGGRVIDSGPYRTYEDASEALDALQAELDEDESSDTPGSQTLDGRYESEE